MSTIQTDFGETLPRLAEHRQVIGIEQQGHGHTPDVDRPLGYEQMADDTAALLRRLEIDRADFAGYSMGGGVALQVAIRHPATVRKVAVVGGPAISPDGLHREIREGIGQLTPEALAGTPYERAYAQTAPDPGNWAALVAKSRALDMGWEGFAPHDVRSITAPVLIVLGDSDITRPEHAVEMFRMLGGGVPGDLVGLPRSRLAVLPGTTHEGVVARDEWLLSMITEFFDE